MAKKGIFYRLLQSRTRCLHAARYNHSQSVCMRVGGWNAEWAGRIRDTEFVTKYEDRNYCRHCIRIIKTRRRAK